MRVLQAERRLTHVIAGLRQRQRAPLLDQPFQRHAIHIFHDQVMGVAGMVGIEHLDDIGMIQAGGGLGFAAKTAHGFYVL